jgi:uncharacterized protein GlcG (DUF336 family)
MNHVEATYRLTEAGAAAIMAASLAKGRQIGIPMSIAIVDAGCNLLQFVRMDLSGSCLAVVLTPVPCF